tara:strand:- start:245 stop:610 length:366 start_codon:yes stop_codon:yes gene_type:complete
MAKRVHAPLDDRLEKYVKRGSLMKLQEYFLATTNGFETLVKIANGEFVAGKNPTVREMLDAWKIIMDKSLPSLQATHVTQDHTINNRVRAVDVGGLDALQAEFAELTREMGKVGKGKAVSP